MQNPPTIKSSIDNGYRPTFPAVRREASFGFAIAFGLRLRFFWLFQKLKLLRVFAFLVSQHLSVSRVRRTERETDACRARDGHGGWAWPWGDAPRPRAGLTRDLTGL